MRWERVVFWILETYAITAAVFAHGDPLLVYSSVLAAVAAMLFHSVPEA
jgi:hypothetical protein